MWGEAEKGRKEQVWVLKADSWKQTLPFYLLLLLKNMLWMASSLVLYSSFYGTTVPCLQNRIGAGLVNSEKVFITLPWQSLVGGKRKKKKSRKPYTINTTSSTSSFHMSRLSQHHSQLAHGTAVPPDQRGGGGPEPPVAFLVPFLVVLPKSLELCPQQMNVQER